MTRRWQRSLFLFISFICISESTRVWGSLADDPLRRPVLVDRPTSLPTANRKLLDFLNARLGQRIGNGQCAGMVSQAYRELEIRDYPAENGDDYVWGTFVTEIRPGRLPSVTILPGDVLQYRDVKFEGRNVGGGTYRTGGAHHTAVVSAVRGQNLYLLQQNVGGDTRPVAEKEKVQGGLIFLPDMKNGWIKVYRPVLRSGASLTDKTGGGGAISIDEGSVSLFKVSLKPRERITYSIEFRAGQSAWIDFNGAGATDVDLFVKSKSGAQVGAETSLADRGKVSFRPASTQVYSVEFANLGDQANTVTIRHNGDKKAGVIGTTTDTATVSPTALNFSRSANLGPRANSSFTVNLAAGKSVRVEMNGSGRTDVDLFVFDASNRQVASDLGGTDRAGLTFTTGGAGNYRIEVRNLGNMPNTVNVSARYVVTR